MVADLCWLGIAWTEPVIVQSDRLPLYRAAMEGLLAAGAVYPCRCSRRELAGAVSAPHEDADDEPVYTGCCRPVANGQCRPETAEFAPARSVLQPGTNYRFRVPDGERVEFEDGHFGPQSFRCGTDPVVDFGDFLVWRRDGLPSYQLASIVDDAAMGITEVVRGRDLLQSTARQLLLARALGLVPPAFFHAPLLSDSTGVRLAKRHDALSIRALREQDLSPAAVCALARRSAEEP